MYPGVQLPPEFDGGDEQSLDMRLPNKVYNKLKTHMQTAAKRSQRIHEKKEHSTMVSCSTVICNIY